MTTKTGTRVAPRCPECGCAAKIEGNSGRCMNCHATWHVPVETGIVVDDDDLLTPFPDPVSVQRAAAARLAARKSADPPPTDHELLERITFRIGVIMWVAIAWIGLSVLGGIAWGVLVALR